MTVLQFRKRVAALEQHSGDTWRAVFLPMLLRFPPPGDKDTPWEVLVYRCAACYPQVREVFEKMATGERAGLRALALQVLEQADAYAVELAEVERRSKLERLRKLQRVRNSETTAERMRGYD